MPLTNLKLRAIRSTDQLRSLSLGHKDYIPLKIFLYKTALHFHQRDIAKTYVLTTTEDNPKKVFGYITLMNSEIILKNDQKPKITASMKYEAFPAVKIARLAIDKSIQGQGYGKKIVQWSIALVKEKITPHIGCRFLVVDAKPNSIEFYLKIGFELLHIGTEQEDEYPALFLDILKT